MSLTGRDCNGVSSNSGKGNNSDNALATCFFSLSPEEFTLLSSLLGVLLIDNLDLNQQNSLGNFIVNLGQAILTSAAQGQLLQSKSEQNDPVRQKIDILKQQIGDLEQEVNNKN